MGNCDVNDVPQRGCTGGIVVWFFYRCRSTVWSDSLSRVAFCLSIACRADHVESRFADSRRDMLWHSPWTFIPRGRQVGGCWEMFNCTLASSHCLLLSLLFPESAFLFLLSLPSVLSPPLPLTPYAGSNLSRIYSVSPVGRVVYN